MLEVPSPCGEEAEARPTWCLTGRGSGLRPIPSRGLGKKRPDAWVPPGSLQSQHCPSGEMVRRAPAGGSGAAWSLPFSTRVSPLSSPLRPSSPQSASLDLKSKEDKDAELDKRIEALRRKNQALIKRYQVGSGGGEACRPACPSAAEPGAQRAQPMADCCRGRRAPGRSVGGARGMTP